MNIRTATDSTQSLNGTADILRFKARTDAVCAVALAHAADVDTSSQTLRRQALPLTWRFGQMPVRQVPEIREISGEAEVTDQRSGWSP